MRAGTRDSRGVDLTASSAFVASLFDIEGQVAIVTGASSGLGRHLSATLHRAGAKVVLAARRADELAGLADELGDGAEPVATDITSDEECERLVAHAMDLHGRIDTLVNCSGMVHPDLPLRYDASMAGFRRVLDVNVSGLFQVSQSVARHMATARSGCIVNVSSIFGQVGGSSDMAYTASKGAIDALTRGLASMLVGKGVRVNAIAPAIISTPLSDGYLADERVAARMLASCPMNRLGRPEELDGALLFLCSAASSYCTGQVLTIDGGWTAV